MKAKTIMQIFLLTMASHVWAVMDYGDLDTQRFHQKWEQVESSFDGVWDTVDVSEFGVSPNEKTGVAHKFQDLLDGHTNKTVFFFPEGDYYFESNIRILIDRIRNDHVIIKGSGPSKTKFYFTGDLEYFTGLIVVEDKASFGDRNNPVQLAIAPKAGDSEIILESANNKLIPGRIICVKQDNDTLLMFPEADKDRAWYQKWLKGEADWGEESMGQFAKVKSVHGTKVVLEDPLGIDFSLHNNPRVSIYDSFGNEVGVEDLYIEHVIPSSKYVPGGTNDVFGIVFRFVENAYVKNVHSVNAARGHVMVEYTYNVSIVNNKFQGAKNYGVGGAGYGVAVQNRSSKTYIANNLFDHLRHSVVLKEGANHSVIAYNVSKNWAVLDNEVVDENGQKILAEADMSVHGFYSHNNLFEGNLCHNIFMADYWGPTGPGTVAFRNRTYGTDTLSGIWVDDFSHHESIIGNELPNKSKLVVTGGSKDVLVEGNLIGESVHWTSLSNSTKLPASLYLDNIPEFWVSSLPWPAFGPDVIPVDQTIRLPVQVFNESVLRITKPSNWRNQRTIQDLKNKHFNLIGRRLFLGDD